MEHTLILVVAICVFVAVLIAVVEYFGWTIPAVLKKIAGFIGVGILIIVLIKLLWPFLMA